MGWLMLMERNIQKYYPKATKTAKGHLNQTGKNIRSTKKNPAPLETCNTFQLHGKKVHNVYTKTYKVRKTMFSNQNGPVPYAIATRQQIYHGDGGNQQQCHPHQTHENLQ
jgi:hypothetical protein